MQEFKHRSVYVLYKYSKKNITTKLFRSYKNKYGKICLSVCGLPFEISGIFLSLNVFLAGFFSEKCLSEAYQEYKNQSY